MINQCKIVAQLPTEMLFAGHTIKVYCQILLRGRFYALKSHVISEWRNGELEFKN